MRQNPSFAMTDVVELRRLIDRNPWMTLVSDTPEGLVASHYAVLLDEERDDLTIVGHVGKPDDMIHGLGESELLVVVQGPHGYISPGWYGDSANVPTWNFVSAHLSGVPEILAPFFEVPDIEGGRIVCSDNDPYCPEGAHTLYPGPADLLEGQGHINPDAGYGPWPAVEAWARDGTTPLTAR